MLHDAPHFCIATLPAHTKLAVENKLRTAVFSQSHQAEINRVIDFMMQGTSQDVDVLHQSIRLVDVRRGQDIVSVAPEFAAVIDYAT
jgi:nanoRNase/pAp phosphatase (c-di-AMP/oligoRNAs hydrolase)